MNWQRLVSEYDIEGHKLRFDREVSWFAAKGSFSQAIADAVASRDENGRCYDHQRRIGRHVYPVAEHLLLEAADTLAASASFDELLGNIRRVLQTVRGAGPLFTYDVTVRIGAKLKLFPEFVYMHAGTRTGAIRFGFATSAHSKVALSSFPSALRALGASHLENFLCIYAGAPRP